MDQIACTHDNLKQMVQYLFHAKYLGSKEIPDDIFLKNVLSILNKYKQAISQTLEENNQINLTIGEKTKDPVELPDLSNNQIEWECKKYLLVETKVYLIKKDGTKGRLYGTYHNNQVIKTQSKAKDIVV